MFENLKKFFRINKKIDAGKQNSKNKAKERLHLVLMQDRANVSADFLDLMRKEIIEVIKKYIDIDEKAMDVRLTTETNEDGSQGAPALYANIPIISIKKKKKKKSKVNQENKIIEANINQSEDKEEKKNDVDLTKEKKEEKSENKIDIVSEEKSEKDIVTEENTSEEKNEITNEQNKSEEDSKNEKETENNLSKSENEDKTENTTNNE